MRNSTGLVFLLTLLGAAAAPPRGARAEPFVHRDVTLPGGVWALDLGLGIGHTDASPPIGEITGLGFNLELKGGLTRELQLGVRTGIRVGTDGKLTRADRYGRTFETETYGTDGETIANPEISLRYNAIDTPTIDLGLDGRIYLPIESGTKVGILLGVPLQFHLSPSVRFDTGIFVPILFYDPTQSVLSFPFHLWLQVDRLAIGPMTGVQIYNPGGHTAVPLGVALNYAATSEADLRAWLLFPDVKRSGGGKTFGVGFGVELRF
jgi:hypothetical protein